MPFANTFWSADYVSGIERLATQSHLSTCQLHELRSLVFSYMKSFHAPGESLSQLWSTAYPHDSSFRVSRGQRNDRRTSRRVVSRGGGVQSPPGAGDIQNGQKSPQTGSHEPSDPAATHVLAYASPDSDFDLDFVFRQCVNNASSHSGQFQALASAIDAQVLAPLTAFIKTHEPVVAANVASLQDAYKLYRTAYSATDSVRQQYTTTARLGDFPVEGKPAVEADDCVEETGAVSLETSPLVFPLVVPGVVRFETRAELAAFLQNIISAVPITKRKIPIPGYSNDIFCAEHLCESFMRNRPKGFNPTRLNTEKLGQALLDWKLIVGTGFFAKKFASENMWFQWSEQAVQLSLNTGEKDAVDDTKRPLDGPLSQLSLSTSKKFNGVLKTMSTFGKHHYSEQELLDQEDDYNESYENLCTRRHLLEMQMVKTTSLLERFERAKIDIIYNSLHQLQKLLEKHLQRVSATASANAAQFEKLNSPATHLSEFEKTSAHFSSGIYFPALLDSSNARPASSNIQNIKLSFNLFKDVPLQVQSGDPADNLRSAPLFLREAVRLVEKHPKKDIAKEWVSPISFEMYWLAKNDVVALIQNFEPSGAVSVQNETAVEAEIISECVQSLSKLDSSRQLNFLKNWLLEIADSVIPSTVYDSIISTYKLKEKEKMTELVRILGTIPRGNLASLVLILEHVSDVFGEGSKSAEEDGKEEKKEDSLTNSEKEIPSENLAETLNSMDAVGAIPFLHIIMRPSVVKHKNGFKPPQHTYNELLSDLLSEDCRQALKQTLRANEESYMQRQQQQKEALELHKRNLTLQRERVRSDSASSPHLAITPAPGAEKPEKPSSGHPGTESDALKPDNFSLRPFRTGTTPRPSPNTSPVHRARSRSVEFNALPKTVISPLNLDLAE